MAKKFSSPLDEYDNCPVCSKLIMPGEDICPFCKNDISDTGEQERERLEKLESEIIVNEYIEAEADKQDRDSFDSDFEDYGFGSDDEFLKTPNLEEITAKPIYRLLKRQLNSTGTQR
jgi:hypothetical protein